LGLGFSGDKHGFLGRPILMGFGVFMGLKLMSTSDKYGIHKFASS